MPYPRLRRRSFAGADRIRRARNVSARSRRRITAAHRGSSLVCRSPPVPIHMHSHSYARTHTRKKTVYDVSSRESFEAVPRWLEELENYVPPEVVKIVVGNKLDKVRAPPPPYAYPNPTCCADTHARARNTGVLPAGADGRGRVVRTAHGVPVRRGVR